MMDISTDLLKSFAALCELRSFSKAAKQLHKSQSAISGQIANLEEQVGLKLFDRSERPLTVTESGEIVLNFALEILNKVEQLDRLIKELASGVTGEVKIGASPSLGVNLLPNFVSEILSKSPNLKITLSVLHRYQIYDAVRRADVDFALVLTDRPPKGLLAKSLKKEPLCFIVSPEHPLSKRKRINLDKIQLVPFVIGTKTSEWTEMISRLLQSVHVSDLPVALRVNNDQAVKEAVMAGIGAAILPQFAVQRELSQKNLCQLNVKTSGLAATIFLIERVRHLYSPAGVAVKNFLEKRISRAH